MICINALLLAILIILGCEISLGREDFKFIVLSITSKTTLFDITVFAVENDKATYALFNLSLGKHMKYLNCLFFIRKVW